MECHNCHQTGIPTGTANCPNCGVELIPEDIGAQINARVEVDQVAEGAEISAVRIEHMGYTAADVRQLLEDLQSRFKPKPFTGECPYVGLEAFGERDAGRFFGRERLVTELVALVKTARFVTVAGPSGSGKSSLVRAGLIPALGEESERNWRAITLRPGRAPLEALGRAVAQLAGQLAPEDDLRQKSAEDASILARWVEVVLGDDPKRRALVVVDQFEELFTQVSEGDEAIRAAFLEQLVYAATLENGRALVLITLRSDFIANCAAYPRLNALLNQGFRQVGPMSPDELVSAIVRPALEVGLKLDPELVEQVVADVGDEPGALPLMQFALKDLFEYEMGKGGVEALTLDGYLARGGLRKALQRHADQAFQNLSVREQELAQSVFRGLIVPGRGHQDTRRTALFTELIPQGVKPEEVEAVIYKLADARLVTTEDREEIPGAERSATLAHERLLEAWPWLQHLVDENREAIQLSNQVADDAARWVAAEHDPSYLYSGARLARTEEWLANDRLTLSQAGKEFLDASVAARDEARLARRRRLQITIAALAAAVVIFAVLAGMARLAQREAVSQASTATYALGLSEERKQEADTQRYLAETASANEATQAALAETNAQDARQQAAEARRQARISLSGQVAAQALSEQLQNRVDTAMLLAAQAYAITDTVRSRASLLSVVQQAPRLEHILTGHEDFVLELAYSPDGSILASAGCARRDLSGEKCLVGDVRLWDTANGHPLGSLEGIDQRVRHLAFSPDSSTLAAADENGGLWVFDLQSQQLVASDELDEEGLNQIVFSPDGSLIYARGGDRLVEVWDVQAGGEVDAALPEELTDVDTLVFSPDGRWAVARGESLTIWQVRAWTQTALITDTRALDAGNLTFSPDGSLLAGTIPGNELLIWDTTSGSPYSEPISGHENRVTRLVFTPDGRTLASADASAVVRLWDIASWSLNPPPLSAAALRRGAQRNRIYEPLLGHTDIVQSLAFSPDGTRLASGGRDLTIRIWDWAAFPSLGEPFTTYPDSILGLAASPNGKLLAFGGCQVPHDPDLECEDGVVVLLDASSGSDAGAPLHGHTGLVTQIAFSPDGSLLASAGWDTTVRLWDLETRQPLGGPLEGHTDFVTGLAFSPDGNVLASSGRDGDLRLWDVTSGEPIGEPLRAHDERIVSLAFSPDGRWVAGGYRGGQIVLWDLSAEPPAQTILTTPIQVNVLDFSPDGAYLASGLADGRILLWVLVGGDGSDPVWVQDNALRAHQDRVSALTFSPDGSLLASGSWDEDIILWDFATGQQIANPLEGHDDFVNGLTFSPDGLTLYSAGRDDLILRWTLDPSDWQRRACRIAARKLDLFEWFIYVGQGDFELDQACSLNFVQ